jgi:Family of unknown function (DUF6445)
MFNPSPVVSLVHWPTQVKVVVADNFLSDPEALQALAVAHRQAFLPEVGNAYPGIGLPLPEAVVAQFMRALEGLAVAHLGVRGLLAGHGRLGLVTRAPEALTGVQRVCHRDRMAPSAGQEALAAVLYLFHDERLGGTNFFVPKQGPSDTDALMARWAAQEASQAELPAAYLTQSNAFFGLAAVVPSRWNRLIIYPGAQFHGSHITNPERLTADPATGRLTLNLFLGAQKAVDGAAL